MPDHSTLTDPFIHEPKGIASVGEGLVYVSDGAGSGNWVSPSYVVNGVIADVSSPSTIYLAMPRAGLVKKVVGTLSAAITVANSIVTVRNSAGLSMGTMTITFTGSAPGSTFSLTPISNNIVTADDFITIVTDGGSTTVSVLSLTVEVGSV
jgi:hypothetical protein